MSPKELINLSLQCEVEIEAHAQAPKAELCSAVFNGLHPLGFSTIPLYLALPLKNANHCSIRTPSYLTRDHLEALIEKERSSQGFTEVPEFLFEHAHIFMNSTIEPLIAELKQVRQKKIWNGLKDIDGTALYINGLTRWEFNEIKGVLVKALELGKKIKQRKK